MRAAGNISIQCTAAPTDADSDAHTCTQTSASGSATYSASLKVGADSSVTFQATQGAAAGLLNCVHNPGTSDGETASAWCTYKAGDDVGLTYATRTLDPKPSLAYTDKVGNDVTLAWS